MDDYAQCGGAKFNLIAFNAGFNGRLILML